MKRITLKRFRDVTGGKVYDMVCGEKRVIVCIQRNDLDNNRKECAAKLRYARSIVRSGR